MAEDSELVAEDEDLQVLGGIAAREQHEQSDGSAQRQVGEFGEHQGGLPVRVAGASPYRATDANTQLTGHVRLCAPFTLTSRASIGKASPAAPCHLSSAAWTSATNPARPGTPMGLASGDLAP